MIEQNKELVDSALVNLINNYKYKFVGYKKFSNDLYDHRNEIVHGKSEGKQLSIPKNVKICDLDDFWLEAVEKIAYKLIYKYSVI